MIYWLRREIAASRDVRVRIFDSLSQQNPHGPHVHSGFCAPGFLHFIRRNQKSLASHGEYE